jgi:hypothetical protein
MEADVVFGGLDKAGCHRGDWKVRVVAVAASVQLAHDIGEQPARLLTPLLRVGIVSATHETHCPIYAA